MSRESALWTWLAKAKLTFRESLHMLRIETSTMKGFPDVEGYLSIKSVPGGGGNFLMELKSSERPAKSETVVRFKVRDREAQINFLKKRWKLGHNAWLLLQVGSGNQGKRYLIPGQHAQMVYDGVPEWTLLQLSVIHPKHSPTEIIQAAVRYRDVY